MDFLTKRQRSKLMSRIRGADTGPEILARRIFRKLGVRFSVYADLPGKPDIFIEPNVCVFVDGSFWHGRDKLAVGGLNLFWKNKIENNVKRDGRVGRRLKRLGYRVIRFWDSEIIAVAKVLGIKTLKAKIALDKRNTGVIIKG